MKKYIRLETPSKLFPDADVPPTPEVLAAKATEANKAEKKKKAKPEPKKPKLTERQVTELWKQAMAKTGLIRKNTHKQSNPVKLNSFCYNAEVTKPVEVFRKTPERVLYHKTRPDSLWLAE